MFKNGMLRDLDAYKLGHMSQYPDDTEYIYSVLQLRYSFDKFDKIAVIGLQYYIKEYLCKEITHKGVEEFISELKTMGIYNSELDDKFAALADLGYLPIQINAIPEGTILNVPNAICTVQNTIPGFHWVVGMVETLLLKIWAPMLTAGTSMKYRDILMKYMIRTSTNINDDVLDFMVHDFGSRGCSSPEHASLTGMGHALIFRGSDTINTIPLVKEYYNTKENEVIIQTIAATEHSVMCAYGMENELDAFNAMLDKYPSGPVSIVSDTYNWYNVMDNITVSLKDRIEARDGKVVFRPDSGNPVDIIIGEIHSYIPKEDYHKYTAKELGGIRSLDKVFGSTINEKGYRVLNPKVGLIYGDSMYLERYETTLQLLEEIGYSVENLIIGVGGILRSGTRDSVGAAFKATWIKRTGMRSYSIMKNPITDSKKKSLKGKIRVIKKGNKYITEEINDNEVDLPSCLVPVYRNGYILKEYSWSEIKQRVKDQINDIYYLDKEAISEYRNNIIITDIMKNVIDIGLTRWGAGEYNVTNIPDIKTGVIINVPYLTFTTIEQLIVVIKYMNKYNIRIAKLMIGYFSYSRQERETDKEPELLSILNNILIKYTKNIPVQIIDIHDVPSISKYGYNLYTLLPKLYNSIIEDGYTNCKLVAPDKGAVKRNKKLDLNVEESIYFDKVRDSKGVHSTINIVDKNLDPTNEYTFIILDDMCDGGRTFANSALEIKKNFPNSKVILAVTHAILPYGVKLLVNSGIDKLYCGNTCMLDEMSGDFIKVI